VGLVAVLFGLALATFFMVRLVPGDPARIVAGPHAPPAELLRIRHQLGLDQPTLAQLGRYLGHLVTLHLGTSFITGEPVTQVISERLFKTFELAGLSLLAVLGVGVPLGIFVGALTHQGRRPVLDAVFTGVMAVMASLPVFVIGTILVYVLAVSLGWLPVAGSTSGTSVILPVLSIALLPMATLARIVRLETFNVLNQDYIRTARSKQLAPLRIYGRHVLPNVLTAALTVASIFFAQLIGGTIVIEHLFAWPGIGSALTDSVLNHDYPVVQGITMLLGVVVVVVNTVVDILLAVIDPRTTLHP
jgi:peptide/nickel transport system permease protein